MIRDREALAALFEAGAVLVAGDDGRRAAARRSRGWRWRRGPATAPTSPIRGGSCRRATLALVVAERGINVVRRGSDGAWRYAIVLLAHRRADGTGKEEP